MMGGHVLRRGLDGGEGGGRQRLGAGDERAEDRVAVRQVREAGGPGITDGASCVRQEGGGGGLEGVWGGEAASQTALHWGRGGRG